ncbi:CRISPR-associated ring nuclease Csm6 [Thiothrix lacustris]|uniref:CRISPR-associated ring nuclease Csm6 n=1 Tax=Thiothrix lacustris TaxID=525917 RepID=UPI0027E3E169|nr:CRISPR-associated ring nuclease Csm6 [Thiothrix lacustris]WMP16500.1 CRISPR-associated ring nuclease Csm6 [Thiothrix lacustris]
MTTEKNQPEHFDRRILLAVAGSSPAILTETLYALAKETNPPYLPTEIHIITTIKGRQSLQPLLGENNKIRALAQDYGLVLPDILESNIHVITDSSGKPLFDITTAAENESAADLITAKVRKLTEDNTASLYVSIAGGRKTMSYYLGYAMSVFGRVQDRMSHVLVDDKYMSADFYYPTPQPQMFKPFSGEPFDASQVPVKLGELPFIRLRDGLTDDLLNKQDLSYSHIIEIAQRQLNPVRVEVRLATSSKGNRWELLCSNTLITGLNKAEFALYVWMLKRHKNGNTPDVQFNLRKDNEALATELLDVYCLLFGKNSGGYSKAYRALVQDDDGRNKEGITSKYFSPKKTNINKYLHEFLPTSGAQYYAITDLTEKETNRTHYYLPKALQADDIYLPHSLFQGSE